MTDRLADSNAQPSRLVIGQGDFGEPGVTATGDPHPATHGPRHDGTQVEPLLAMPLDALQTVLGIAGIVEIDLDIRSVIRDPFSGLGPVGAPVLMPQLP